MSSSFFFSSRRRHTRSLCDWSSDVCSSDLVEDEGRLEGAGAWPPEAAPGSVGAARTARSELNKKHRSEERRVGKECRSRWGAYHYENKKRIVMHWMLLTHAVRYS